jgi:hypothetical protein
MKNVFFAMNRKAHVATIVTGFACWEMVQNAALIGLQIEPGIIADGIGRMKSREEFLKRASYGRWRVVWHDGFRPETAIERTVLTSGVIHKSRQMIPASA